LFDEGVFNVTAAQFDKQIKWFKRNTIIASEERLGALIRSADIPSKPVVLITFDDGYRDNYTIAYPILKKLGVPAIFFISTHLVASRKLGWWDIVAYLIKQSPRAFIDFQRMRFALQGDRGPVVQRIQHYLKMKKQDAMDTFITELAAACEVGFPSLEVQDTQLLTWDQIRTMSHDAISIGSHGHTHRVLTALAPASQREEMKLSKAILERETGRQINSIAYPGGESYHFSESTRKLAHECGFRFGFTANTGANMWRSIDALELKRVSGLGGLEDVSAISSVTVLPEIFN